MLMLFENYMDIYYILKARNLVLKVQPKSQRRKRQFDRS